MDAAFVLVRDDVVEVAVTEDEAVIEDEVARAVEDELLLELSPDVYMLSRLGPPQYSV